MLGDVVAAESEALRLDDQLETLCILLCQRHPLGVLLFEVVPDAKFESHGLHLDRRWLGRLSDS